MLLAIVQNPFSKNPNELTKQLQPEEVRLRSEKLDVAALDNFKRNLNIRSGLVVKS